MTPMTSIMSSKPIFRIAFHTVFNPFFNRSPSAYIGSLRTMAMTASITDRALACFAEPYLRRLKKRPALRTPYIGSNLLMRVYIHLISAGVWLAMMAYLLASIICEKACVVLSVNLPSLSGMYLKFLCSLMPFNEVLVQNCLNCLIF